MKSIYKSIPAGAIKVQVPDTRQIEDFTCGASALQAVCGYFGVGPDEEEDYVKDMEMKSDGSDPEHLIRAAKKYKLKYLEIQPMNIKQLKGFLKKRLPVIIMIQAWSDKSIVNYAVDWKDGHWVVAIGYDKEGVYFEDPSLAAKRGFINYKDLEIRWHDIVGKKNIRTDHYGLILWKAGQMKSAYSTLARLIE